MDMPTAFSKVKMRDSPNQRATRSTRTSQAREEKIPSQFPIRSVRERAHPTLQICSLRSVSMAALTSKQVLVLALLLSLASLDSVSARTQCQGIGAACSDERPCCGEMRCHWVAEYFWKCKPTEQAGCDAATEQFHANFHEGRRYLGSSVRRSSCKLSESCQDLDRSDISSLTWSENAVLAVYDEESCGGNSLLVYSAGPYKKVLDDGNTRTQGFLAGGVQDLSKVCKHDRCGYDSYANAPLGGVLQANNNGSCECVENWNDSIRSYRIFKRPPHDIKNIF